MIRVEDRARPRIIADPACLLTHSATVLGLCPRMVAGLLERPAEVPDLDLAPDSGPVQVMINRQDRFQE
ncbi:hypothetical protein [Streptomyces phaeofaciens]|uniref:hypothetical protein n=1 Tax=Streptomyces phaeofaciens TaxID=68254 RepID=UPI00367A8E62